MSSTHGYDKDRFLSEFFPDEADRNEVAAGAWDLINVSRATRLADMRKRLGLSQADMAERMHVRQERVSAIERARSPRASYAHWRPTSKLWAAGWRSSPTSAESAWLPASP